MHRRTEALYALGFLAPYLFVLGVFFLYAFLRTVYFSFTQYDLFHTPEWVGFRNYAELFRDDLFLRALRNTLFYSFFVTVVQTFLALVLAAILNTKIRGVTFFRTVYYLPSILSSAAATLIFIWVFQRRGFLNYALGWLEAHAPILLTFLGLFLLFQLVQVAWERGQGLPVHLFDPALAAGSLILALALTWFLVALGVLAPREGIEVKTVWLNTRREWLGVSIPLWSIIIMNIYTTIPTFMLIFLAGLQDIPKTIYEAAAIDGATPIQQFFRITVPLLRPVIFLVVTMSLIGTLQLFDQVALIGNAAPLESTITLAYYVYNSVFPSGATPKVGFGAGAALVLAVLTLLVVLLQRRFGISERGY